MGVYLCLWLALTGRVSLITFSSTFCFISASHLSVEPKEQISFEKFRSGQRFFPCLGTSHDHTLVLGVAKDGPKELSLGVGRNVWPMIALDDQEQRCIFVQGGIA